MDFSFFEIVTDYLSFDGFLRKLFNKRNWFVLLLNILTLKLVSTFSHQI